MSPILDGRRRDRVRSRPRPMFRSGGDGGYDLVGSRALPASWLSATERSRDRKWLWTGVDDAIILALGGAPSARERDDGRMLSGNHVNARPATVMGQSAQSVEKATSFDELGAASDLALVRDVPRRRVRRHGDRRATPALLCHAGSGFATGTWRTTSSTQTAQGHHGGYRQGCPGLRSAHDHPT
jgi:hypothetical protein